MSVFQVERIDVEESLSPLSMSMLENSSLSRSTSHLEEVGQEDGDDGEKMKFSTQFQDFTMVEMSWWVYGHVH